ncbi:TPA: hypothetical protein ACH3X2_011704 [Trebouxia sp. C0005]
MFAGTGRLASCLDKQPDLGGPITDFGQWEESKATYIHKRAMYYRLHQEMEGAKTQLKGWRKAVHKAGSDTQKVRLEQCFDSAFERMLPLMEKWDNAFFVLQDELEALHEHMQAFYDQHVPPVDVT